jgi:hypothetical protein
MLARIFRKQKIPVIQAKKRKRKRKKAGAFSCISVECNECIG